MNAVLFCDLTGGKGIGGVDGGIRVPGLFRWPGAIKPGSVSDVVTTQLDIFPLISALTNSPLPQDREIDGKDILPVLKGEQTDSPYDYVYHYCDGVIVAVRYMPRGGNFYLRSLFPFYRMCWSYEFSLPKQPQNLEPSCKTDLNFGIVL